MPPFEQTLNTHTKGLFVCNMCNILEFYSVDWRRRFSKSCKQKSNFCIFPWQVLPKWSFTIILTDYEDPDLDNLLAQYGAPLAGCFREVDNVKIEYLRHNL